MNKNIKRVIAIVLAIGTISAATPVSKDKSINYKGLCFVY